MAAPVPSVKARRSGALEGAARGPFGTARRAEFAGLKAVVYSAAMVRRRFIDANDRAARRAPTERRAGRLTALVAAALILADIAASAAVWRDGERAASALPAETADAGVVYFTDDPEALERRLGRAVDLWREGRVRALYMVGGFRTPDRAAGSRLMADAAIAAGLPSGAVGADGASFDTRTNVAAAAAKAASSGWAAVAHVTDGMQLSRLRRDIERDDSLAPLSNSYYVSVPYGSLFDLWVRAQYEMIVRVLTVVTPDGAVTDLAERLRLGGRRPEAQS